MKQSWEKTKTSNNEQASLPNAARDVSVRGYLMVKILQTLLCESLALLILWGGLLSPAWADGHPQKANGIQPLIEWNQPSLHQLVPRNIRPLLLPQEQEQFLQELEGGPPDWRSLQSRDHTVQSERLFQLNRERDQARLVHKQILQEPVAFLWSGLLRKYLPEYHGFSVALGPVLTSTSWGIVRFKPMELPDYLVAIPSEEATSQILRRQQGGEQIEIGVMFMGTLIPDESLMYAFSHDDQEDGMILPVVHIQRVQYVLQHPIDSVPHNPLSP